METLPGAEDVLTHLTKEAETIENEVFRLEIIRLGNYSLIPRFRFSGLKAFSPNYCGKRV